ncbi:MAG: hypothetical protein UW32_C0001G0116 [Candidatus Wolfebacteria bacterium GW2011_GWE2_44_13]|uniref:Uncharacterized protein n=1 Tax=Candidatus Wolfebacteria bacterium GW2011_GWE2_44_13 TaxID=1619017 RepID=A0A0G1K6N9_9BACT|nr:MAG: hypothetical protein UW32_C0001G0116 [Candidatus Wolfebacteria bacterium GW2011_GWE2_44_13]
MLFFVAFAMEDQNRRAVYAVEDIGGCITLSEKMAKGRNPAGLLGTKVPLSLVAFDRGRVFFHLSSEIVESPVAGIFASLEQAIPCFDAEQLEVLDMRWLEETMRCVVTMQKPFPQAGQCRGNCGQAGCL